MRWIAWPLYPTFQSLSIQIIKENESINMLYEPGDVMSHCTLTGTPDLKSIPARTEEPKGQVYLYHCMSFVFTALLLN